MGLLNIPFPLFDGIDVFLQSILPLYGRILFWAFVASAGSMAIYVLCSPQRKIADTREKAKVARMEMARYDGDFNGMLALSRRSLTLSLKQLGLTAGPAILASLPILFLIAWVSVAYGYRFPDAGTPVALTTVPTEQDILIRAGSGEARPADGAVEWPAGDEAITVAAPAGATLLELPLVAPMTIVHKRRWWNVLFANPAGYLPEGTTVESISLTLPVVEVLDVGPAWMRSWELIFFAALVIFSLAIKFAFRIN